MKQQRRAKGDAAPQPIKDGRYRARLALGNDPITGQRKSKDYYGDTAAKAVKARRIASGKQAEGHLVPGSTPYVKDFIESWYRQGLTRSGKAWAGTTKRTYRTALDLHLLPAFGSLRLEKLTTLVIQHWLNEHHLKHGARQRISNALATLRSALTDAVALSYIPINPARAVKLAAVKKKPIKPLTHEEAQAFTIAVRGHQHEALFCLTLALGCRMGESTGLPRTHLDLATGEVAITQQLQYISNKGEAGHFEIVPGKTEKGQRVLQLPPSVLELVRAHLVKQEFRKLKAGADWRETGMLFTNEVGGYLFPKAVNKELHAVLKAAGLRRITFHWLRHGVASALIGMGWEIAEVGGVLGHTQSATTTDIYGHLVKATVRKAAAAMETIWAGKAKLPTE